MCKFSSKSGGVPFQPLGDLTWNDPQARTRIDCKILGCHYLTRHALEHTRGQHSKERKPGFRLSAKKPPDQIRRPEDYSLQHYRETPSGIL